MIHTQGLDGCVPSDRSQLFCHEIILPNRLRFLPFGTKNRFAPNRLALKASPGLFWRMPQNLLGSGSSGLSLLALRGAGRGADSACPAVRAVPQGPQGAWRAAPTQSPRRLDDQTRSAECGA